MRCFAIILPIVVLLCGLPISQASEADDVVKLNKHNFQSHTSNGHWFIKFYAPWCTFCKKLAPTWSSAATTARKTQLSVKLAEFDCTTDTDFCKDLGVTGYPTMYFFARGQQKKQYQIGGSVTEADLLNFAKDQLVADGVSIVSPDQLGSDESGPEYKTGLFGFLKYYPTRSFLMNVYLFISLIIFMLISSCWFFFTYIYYLSEEEEQLLREQEMANRGEEPSPPTRPQAAPENRKDQ